jgi:subtilisin family serine protease
MPTPTPTPTAAPFNEAAFLCPTSDAPAGVTRISATSRRVTRGISRHARTTTAGTMLAVTYDRTTAATSAVTIASRERSLGSTLVRSFDFPHTGLVTRVLAVPAARMASVEAAMRLQPGVRSVGLTGQRRFVSTVTAPLFTQDPYFQGFTTNQISAAGITPTTATFETGPLEESANVPGQWDAHVTGLEDAFAYSQVNNGSGVSSAGAIGLSSVNIAIIDTGEDTNHPDLTSKIVHQGCFITDPNGNQSSSGFETDPQGHGTDVAGLAAEDTGNNYGFSGAGGNSSLFAYRVFPTPDDNCANDNSNDDQCGAVTTDIASAIEDAIANHANVISMSLGGGGCVNGVDTDPVEGAAVAEAIAANVIVVAAAGNEGASQLDAPGCDTGVLGVGASALADGTPTGSNSGTVNGLGTATSPVEYVASYSNFGGPANVHNANAWGIVAPGADPSTADETSASGGDLLHWVTNIWTTTPFMANANDTSFSGACFPDILGASGAIDCQILIAGTSMATPHVAGSAALILSATGGSSSPFQNPAMMRALLCQTSDDIHDPNEGCGRLNIYRAMAIALNDPNPPTAPSSVFRRR